MIFGAPFSVRKFNRYAREGGDDGVLCEPGYFAKRKTYAKTSMAYSYMGMPVYLICYEKNAEPVHGIWCATLKRDHTWDVVVGANLEELKSSIRTYKGMSF